MRRLKRFTNNTYKFNIIWQSRKFKTLFKLKDKIQHKANVIYRGTSNANSEISYIGETKQIAEARWKQHENPSHDSAPSKYLIENADDSFTWEILCRASDSNFKRKIHEAYLQI